MANSDDTRWLAAAAALAERVRPLSRPNPAVGAIIVKDGKVVGRGWTGIGGRPHAEAIALRQAGKQARGATLYVTLEPCAHRSQRGPACADLVAEARLARVLVGTADPDHRTHGNGLERIRSAGMAVDLPEDAACLASLEGYLSQKARGRPYVTLKLAMSLDGCIALRDGKPLAITGDIARTHVHRDRARHDAILVGGATQRADNPRLDVRLPGLEGRSPQRMVLTRGEAPAGWEALSDPAEVSRLADVQFLYVEGGAQTAAAFLERDLVDRLMIYRAPILIGGEGLSAIGAPGPSTEPLRSREWQFIDRRMLGSDTLEIYRRRG